MRELQSYAPRSSPQPPRPGLRGQSEVEPQNKGPLKTLELDSGLTSEVRSIRWTEQRGGPSHGVSPSDVRTTAFAERRTWTRVTANLSTFASRFRLCITLVVREGRRARRVVSNRSRKAWGVNEHCLLPQPCQSPEKAFEVKGIASAPRQARFCVSLCCSLFP